MDVQLAGGGRVTAAAPAALPGAGGAGANGAARGGARLEVEDVKILFGGVAAVGGVSLTVPPGAVVGLVGPNGAGKTTLLNAISGFVRANEGSVAIDGEPILRRGPQHRTAVGVARTFQNLSLHHGLSVLDHAMIGQHASAGYGALAQSLRLPRFLRGETRMRRHAEEVLAALELERFAGEEVENLPYGIQKRVDVARAVVSSPRLLLLDEPAAGLTPAEGNDLVNRVLALAAAKGTTVVLVEHNIDLVMRVADRVVALNFGKVIADDVPNEVRVHKEFVRSYLGA
jgi:ABC-type branched-subunit amino acid transport system ATPase component